MSMTYEVWVGEKPALRDCEDPEYAIGFAKGVAHVLREQKREEDVWVQLVQWYNDEEGEVVESRRIY